MLPRMLFLTVHLLSKCGKKRLVLFCTQRIELLLVKGCFCECHCAEVIQVENSETPLDNWKPRWLKKCKGKGESGFDEVRRVSGNPFAPDFSKSCCPL